jgi:outer membrane protein OmpA-like peptidoglycan-associated protein
LILSAAVTPITAQIADGGVTIHNVDAQRQGDMVRVVYSAAIAKKAVGWNHTLLVAPVIVGAGGVRQSLPAFAVHGPGSRAARERREIAYGTMPVYENAAIAARGDTVEMSADVPFGEWMHGSNIVFESIEAGCCEFGTLARFVAARGILPPPPAPEPAPEPEPEPVRPSVGDSLATVFKFVAPYSDFENFSIDDEDRDNGLEIYFPLARYNIEPGYMDNTANLADLIGAIRAITASTDSRVSRIVVAGFASPEGTIEFNETLAYNRAIALKSYIMTNTVITDDQVAIYNGAVDWQGLRIRIDRGTLPEREALLDLIDNTPTEGTASRPGRLDALKRMNGGATYRYLQAEHFPWLRTGAFIKVFYDNR